MKALYGISAMFLVTSLVLVVVQSEHYTLVRVLLGTSTVIGVVGLTRPFPKKQ